MFLLQTSLAVERRTPVVLAVEAATPAVLSLEIEQPAQSSFYYRWEAPKATGQGSGVVIAPEGVVLTNAHVVAGAVKIVAHTSEGRSYQARVIGMDEDLDLAVLRLEGVEYIPSITVDTDSPILGETVIAIGNPYGLGLTVSTGVVSSVSREVEIKAGIKQPYIQTDAAINPGNSGGALVNVEGNLIGINTAIYAQGEGIGFAIPAERAMKIARDLLTYGSVRAPWLGADLQDLDRRALVGTPLKEGAVRVSGVFPGGPAATAGLEKKDLLYRADDRPIRSRADLNAYLATLEPGAAISLSLYRDTQPITLSLPSIAIPPDLGTRVMHKTLGISVQPRDGGLTVTAASPTGTWAHSRLRVGDRIVAVNGERVQTEEELTDALTRAKAAHRPSAMFTVTRGRSQGTLVVSI
jgi:S1-C subfamily serine protease